jgi:hypothetical protein
MVSITQWSDPCSVLCTAHLTMASIKFSEARMRLIVDK